MSLPLGRAIARLVPSVCGTLPPREGGLHVRLAHQIIAQIFNFFRWKEAYMTIDANHVSNLKDHAMAKQLLLL